MNNETENLLHLLNDLVKLHAPPGHEDEVAAFVTMYWQELDLLVHKDHKGNMFVELPNKTSTTDNPSVLVLAHMDEVAMMVARIEQDGLLRVNGLGGVSPAKLGEGPVDLLTPDGILTGILSLGDLHPGNTIKDENPLGWESVRVFTGLTPVDLKSAGVRPGTYVCISRSRKGLLEFGSFVGSYTLDDRAFLAVLLQLPKMLREHTFKHRLYLAATAGEEAGGEGARYLAQSLKPTITIALDVLALSDAGASRLDAMPGAWLRDSKSIYDRQELERFNRCCEQLGFQPHWALNASGATDASFAAASGYTARAVGLGIPVANVHGFEIMHKEAPDNLLKLFINYIITLDRNL